MKESANSFRKVAKMRVSKGAKSGVAAVAAVAAGCSRVETGCDKLL